MVILMFIFLRSIRLPGFKGMGLYDVLRFFINAMTDRKFTLAGAAMAYRFFFALIPGLIAITSLISVLQSDNLKRELNDFLATFTPPDSMGFVTDVVEEFAAVDEVWLAVFNFALMIFSAIGGIRAMMQAFSKDEIAFKRRNFFQAHGLAFLIFFVLIILLLLVMSVWVGGEVAIHYVGSLNFMGFPLLKGSLLIFMARGFHWLVVLLALFFMISILYFLAPETHKRFSFFSPGSLLSGFLMMVAIIGFRFFVTHFENINKFYGSLSAIMILMVWFYWISIVLLIGFELNAAIDMALLTRKKRLRTSKDVEEYLKRQKEKKQEEKLLEAARKEEEAAKADR